MNKKIPLNPFESDAFLYIVISVLLMFSVNKAFSQSELLMDINQLDDNTYNEYSNFVGGPERLYFVSEGRDLYYTKIKNGNEETNKIKSFLSVGNLTVIGTTLYFSANDGLNGQELWRSDGTADGTTLVKDIRVGSIGSAPESLTDVNGSLYFVANNGTNGKEVWRSNGLAGGTMLVKDILAKGGSSNPAHLTNVNGTLFFAANDGIHGYELWKSNGTASGTVLVKDIRPEAKISSSPEKFAAIGSSLLFTANEPASGRELWKSDGTLEGTVLVKDVRAGTGSSAIENIIGINGVSYFTATDGIYGHELWRSDGTASGTYLLKDMTPGAAGSHGEQVFSYKMGNFTNVNGSLFYTAYQDNSYFIWKSDGTSGGTIPLHLCHGPGIGQPRPNFKLMNGNIYYFNYTEDEYYSYGLWRMNADGSSPTAIYGLSIDAYDYDYPLFAVVANTTLYFATRQDYYTTGFSIFRSNGSPGGTQALAVDTYQSTLSSNPTKFSNVNKKVVFAAQIVDANYNYHREEIYATDGTPQGTYALTNGFDWTTIGDIITVGPTAYVAYGANVIATDGTVAGTTDLGVGGNYYVENLKFAAGNLFYSNYNGELWKLDPASRAHTLMKDFNSVISTTSLGSALSVRVQTASGGEELWRTNGTTSGTYRYKTLRTEFASPAYVYPTAQLKSIHFFVANDGIHGNELWRTAGSGASTYMVADLNPNDNNFKPNNYNEFDIASMATFRDSLYVSAVDNTGTWSLFKTNGTSAGIRKVTDLNAVHSMFPIGNNKMLMFVFRNNDRSTVDLWVTNGTANGTKLLNPFGVLYYPTIDVRVVNGKALFMLKNEIWSSDGTECGTYPTNLGVSSEKQFAITGNQAIFSGGRRGVGYEPHAFDLNQIGSAPCTEMLSAKSFTDAEIVSTPERIVRQAPNPFNSDFSLTISGNENETADVEVYSLSGVSVESFRALSCNVEHRLGNRWNTGMYIMKINKSGVVHTEKILKR